MIDFIAEMGSLFIIAGYLISIMVLLLLPVVWLLMDCIDRK